MSRKFLGILLSLIVAGIVVIMFFPAIFRSKKLFEVSPLLGKEPPDFTIDGKSLYSIIDESKDKMIIINFFASWCRECKEDRNKLANLKKRFVIIGVVFQDTKDNVERYLKELNPYDYIFFDSGETAIDYGVTGVPETFIVKEGRIYSKLVGPINISELEKIIQYR